MSKLGNIKESYGKSFNTAVANTYSSVVLDSQQSLPANMLIISSPVDDEGHDLGTYSLLITDNSGTPVRLTYTIQEGNGLHYSIEDDSLSLKIDDDTIRYDEENGLTVDLSKHLANSLHVDSGKLDADITNFPITSTDTFGISYIDGATIKTDDNTIYVNTSSLRYANNNTEEYGIVIGDGKTIKIDNGKLVFNVSNLRAASSQEYGLTKGDEYTVHSSNGILSVVTENLDHVSEDGFGTARIDGKSIVLNDDNEITVNENNLSTASSSDFGISKIDSNTLSINNNGTVSVKEYGNILNQIKNHKDIYDAYKKKLDDYVDYLSSGNVLLKNKNILLFAINETSTVELDKPNDNEEVVNMPLQTVTAVFDIVTTCDFILNIDFEEGTNEFPLVDLLEVNYNDEISYSKVEALDPMTKYPSTKGELKKLIVKFSAKNFRNSVKMEHIITNVNMVLSSAEDHNKNLTQKYSILRYNSAYVEEEGTAYQEEYYVLVPSSIYWNYVD